MKLYLMRHGSAARIDGGDAVLTEGGTEEVRRVAAHLRRIAEPQEIRHSTKERARQTGEILGTAFGLPPVEARGMTPMEPVEEIAGDLALEPDDLFIVSHLPWIERMAARLLESNGRSDTFVLPPASVLCLQRAEYRPGKVRWWVRWFVTPAILPEEEES
jgi:phosphohistidine phosphatase